MRHREVPADVEEVGRAILSAGFHAHTELGPALREPYYTAALAHVLRSRGRNVRTEVRRDICIGGLVFPGALRADLVVDHRVIVEVKAVESVHAVHRAQVFSYLWHFGLPLGFVLNFRAAHLRDGIHRVVWTRAK